MNFGSMVKTCAFSHSVMNDVLVYAVVWSFLHSFYVSLSFQVCFPEGTALTIVLFQPFGGELVLLYAGVCSLLQLLTPAHKEDIIVSS